MKTSRLEAFTDAVIAIIMTIMALELKPPHGGEWAVLRPLLPVFLAYILSFAYLAIYWNNHHHMLHAAESINGRILWANQILLFCLSLIPFTTHWMGENITGHLGDNHAPPLPTALYGLVLCMSALAYTNLQNSIIAHEGPGSRLKRAIGNDVKGKASILLYLIGVAVAFVVPWVSVALYAGTALIWLVPDRRIESRHMPAAE